MKKTLIGALCALFILVAASSATAAPTNQNKAENNSQVVAYYESGVHAIPTDPITYVEDVDLVARRGNSGQIQQWYTGADNHGIHSVWNLSKDGSCADGWVLIEQAYPNWGDYLVPGADYCVHNNSF